MTNIRKLLTTEYDLYEAHLLRLTSEDRAMRFAAGVGEGFIREYVAGLDPARTLVLGHFEAGELRGAAEIAGLDTGWPPEAELAVTVEVGHQGRGIGTELVRRILVVARNRSIQKIHAICLADNIKMRKIVQKFDGNLAYRHGMVEGDIELIWPTQFTVMEEVVGDSTTMLNQWLERLRQRVEARSVGTEAV
ncbi:MAG: GNAT family N-acetyltransferase [Alphaproteobacteria bacterium]|nr:GNAT family N-acetyltransferase [Alphaproteobacteria bacterium]